MRTGPLVAAAKFGFVAKHALLSVKSITDAPDGATGEHFAKVLDRLGIADQVKGKIKPNSPGHVAQAIAKQPDVPRL